MSGERSFYGKLLLFGEYTVVLGEQALVVPYDKVGGSWAFMHHCFDKAKAAASNHALKNYLRWLEQSPEAEFIDIERFERDIEAGMIFDSNIPNGYGVGSSGALVAALFDRYRLIDIPEQLSDLKSLLGRLENYFHGNSSGLDPLACYIGKPLLINDMDIRILEDCPVPAGLRLELHDTCINAPTGPLVEFFKEQLKHYSFYKKIDRRLIPFTAQAVKSWLTDDIEELWKALKEISAFQFENFSPMIPESVRPLWQQSLTNDNYCMKLCGSGGGGYVMKFIRSI